MITFHQPDPTLDKATLEALLKEARCNHRDAKRLYEKHDNCDAMHEMDQWSGTCEWLENHLAALFWKGLPNPGDR